MAHKIWLVLTAIVLWAVGQTVWAQSIELTPEKRQELYDITRKSALTTAQKKINSNSFLSAEKKAILSRHLDQLFNRTELIHILVDDIVDIYGDKLFKEYDEQAASETAKITGYLLSRYNNAGGTYLSDEERKNVLIWQNEIMSRLEPQYCVLYANGVLTIDSLAPMADTSVNLANTLSSKQLQLMLDTQLNILTLGSLHRGKPRQVSRAQYDTMTELLSQELVYWVESFALDDLPVVEAYLTDKEISAKDYCALSISLNQRAIEATGKNGELLRLMSFLATFAESEVIAE